LAEIRRGRLRSEEGTKPREHEARVGEGGREGKSGGGLRPRGDMLARWQAAKQRHHEGGARSCRDEVQAGLRPVRARF
jgi:hypothetical protein